MAFPAQLRSLWSRQSRLWQSLTLILFNVSRRSKANNVRSKGYINCSFLWDQWGVLWNFNQNAGCGHVQLWVCHLTCTNIQIIIQLEFCLSDTVLCDITSRWFCSWESTIHHSCGDSKTKTKRTRFLTMTLFRTQRSCKISETLELSLYNCNMIKQRITKAVKIWSSGGYRLISVTDWWKSIKIERENNMPLLIIMRVLAEVESLSENCGLLNHCAVCSGMPVFTERSLMKNLWLHDEHPHTHSVNVLVLHTP